MKKTKLILLVLLVIALCGLLVFALSLKQDGEDSQFSEVPTETTQTDAPTAAALPETSGTEAPAGETQHEETQGGVSTEAPAAKPPAQTESPAAQPPATEAESPAGTDQTKQEDYTPWG